MDESSAFAAEVVPQLRAEVAALHDGDLGPRLELWSHRDPVTLFGAWFTADGWSEVEPVFRKLAATFTGNHGIEYEVLAAGASGELGYLVGLEHSHASVDGEPRDYTLRVTTIFRREDGRWKVIHRHGDELGDTLGPVRDPA